MKQSLEQVYDDLIADITAELAIVKDAAKKMKERVTYLERELKVLIAKKKKAAKL